MPETNSEMQLLINWSTRALIFNTGYIEASLCAGLVTNSYVDIHLNESAVRAFVSLCKRERECRDPLVIPNAVCVGVSLRHE